MDTRIKICGITRVEDALAAIDAGVDMLGLNFTHVSPRRIDTATAVELSRAIDSRAIRVGLFLDQPASEVQAIIDQVELDLLQFHGEETGDYCRSFDKPYIKAFRLSGRFDAQKAAEEYPDAHALLLDAYVAGVPGGTGVRVDPQFWPDVASVPLLLAGGLTPENVACAIAALKPWGVDVSGGVETGTKGIKDPQKMVEFVMAVKAAVNS